MKQFIFFADDFGLTPQINQGIYLAYRTGVVRLVSLMVTREAGEEAVAIARQCPDMIVGLHLDIDGLIGVDLRTWAGERCSDLMSRINAPGMIDRVKHESERQVETYRSLGFSPTFINSHYNIHTIPHFFPDILELARSAGFGFMRFSPHDRLLSHPDLPISDEDLSHMTAMLKDTGIDHADWFRPTFCYFFPPDLSEGLTEIAFHPAWNDSVIGHLDMARLLSWGSIMRSGGAREAVV